MYLLGRSPMIDAMVLIDEVHSLEIYKLPKNLKGFSGAKIKIFSFSFFVRKMYVILITLINE